MSDPRSVEKLRRSYFDAVVNAVEQAVQSIPSTLATTTNVPPKKKKKKQEKKIPYVYAIRHKVDRELWLNDVNIVGGVMKGTWSKRPKFRSLAAWKSKFTFAQKYFKEKVQIPVTWELVSFAESGNMDLGIVLNLNIPEKRLQEALLTPTTVSRESSDVNDGTTILENAIDSTTTS